MSAAGGEQANEALELAQRGFEHFNAGDLEAFWEVQHPEVVMATDPLWPGGGTYEGVDAFKRFLEQFLDAFSTVRWEQAHGPEAVGDVALFRGKWVGSGASTGIETSSVEFSVVFAARDGRIDQARFFYDEAEARAVADSLARSR